MPQTDTTCIELVRHHLPDFYAAHFFAPKDKRETLITLYAVFAELMRISDQVSEPMLGEIRLQWWRDALEPAYYDDQGQQTETQPITGHPIADAFVNVIKDYHLPKVHVSNMIDARSFDMSIEHMPDWQSSKIYLNKTYGSLFFLSGCLLGCEKEDTVLLQKVSQLAAQAYGLTQLLNLFPVQVAKYKLYLPASVFTDNNLNIGELLHEQKTDGLDKVLESLAREIDQHHEVVSGMLKKLPAQVHAAFLPLAVIRASLKKITSAKHDIFRDIVDINPLYRLFRYWYAMGFGKF